jgi:hypothetical protein
MTRDGVSVSVDLARLRKLGEDCRLLSLQLIQLRGLRDKVALDLVDDGVTWRDVAEAAGFENPYIAQLQARRAEHSHE